MKTKITRFSMLLFVFLASYNIADGVLCTGTPVPGATVSSVNYVCAGTNPITLSMQNIITDSGISYQWQSSPISNFSSGVTNLGTASTEVITAPATNTFYRCLVTCSNGGGFDYSTPLELTIRPVNVCTICTSTTGSCSPLLSIQNITFAGINQAVPCGVNGYSDNRSGQHASVISGSTYPLSLIIGGQANIATVIFIDWNQNGLLTDAGESYTIAPFTLATSTVTGSVNILVPPAIPSGVAVLRIKTRSNSFPPGPCGGGGSGQVVDFLVDISQPPSCSAIPNPGNTISTLPVCSAVNFTLSLQNPSYAPGISYQWQSAPDVSGVPGAWSNTAGTAYQYTTSVTSTTWFRCSVTCASFGGSVSTPLQVIPGTVAECAPYCIPSHSSNNGFPCAYGLITKVILNTLSYSPACYATLAPAYALIPPRDSATTTLSPDSTYQLRVTVAKEGNAAAWIDWNRDGVFSATEFYFIGTNNNGTPVTLTANILVPNSFPMGTVRIRISTEYPGSSPNGSGDACSTAYLFGESLDFIFDMLQPNNCAGTPSPGNTISSSNNQCSQLGFTLSLQNYSPGAGTSYQWQSAPDVSGSPGTWTNAAGAPNANTFTTTTAATSWFRCEVSCSSSGLMGTSNPLQIIVVPCIFMSNGSSTTCDTKFYDSGGPLTGYGNAEYMVHTVYPDVSGNVVRVTFSSFSLNTLNPGDLFGIYDGPDTLSQVLYYAYDFIGGPYTATLANGGSLTFKFISDANNVFDGSGWDATISCVLGSPTGNDESENLGIDILVSPNPAKSELRIHTVPAGKIKTIEIYDVMGEKVFHQQLTANSKQPIVIDVSELTHGIYFVAVTDKENNIRIRKIVKM